METALIDNILYNLGTAAGIFALMFLWLREKTKQLKEEKEESAKVLSEEKKERRCYQDKYEGLLSERITQQQTDLLVWQRLSNLPVTSERRSTEASTQPLTG